MARHNAEINAHGLDEITNSALRISGVVRVIRLNEASGGESDRSNGPGLGQLARVLANLMLCLRGGVVANVVVAPPNASDWRIVENLCGYAQRDPAAP